MHKREKILAVLVSRSSLLASWLTAISALALGCNDIGRVLPEASGESAELMTSGSGEVAGGRQLPAWQMSTPEAQGLDSAKLADALLAMRDQHINIHSLMLVRNGKAVVNAYFYPYDGDALHDLASVTKSVMTTLIGIAIDQGKLKLDDRMVSFFPERTIAHRSARKDRITVGHLASMTSGLDCLKEPNEPTLAEMQESPDWIQFILDREVTWEPGTRFEYCSSGTHLLSAILQQATGMKAVDFARKELFGPLGVRELIWPLDPQGYNTGWGELRLHPHDMAKLGTLWMNHGRWRGRQIVSQAWVEAAVQPLVETREGDYYGYGWWVDTMEPPYYRADGRGGQYIVVIPSVNIMVVTTGGGFKKDQIDPLLVSTLVSPDKALPYNHAGLSQLRTAIAAVQQPPAALPVPALPALASVISGKTYALEPNPARVSRIGFEFASGAEATLHYTQSNDDQEVVMPIGLDGVYRLSPGDYDIPEGARGQWSDAQTFALEYDEIANNGHLLLKLRFSASGDHVTVEMTDLSGAQPTQVEGTLIE